MPSESHLRRAAGWIGFAVGALGVVTLAGAVISWNPFQLGNAVNLNPNVALVVMLSGASLWLQTATFRRAGILCGAAVLVITLTLLSQRLLGLDLGLDQFGRLSLHVALGWTTAALALLALPQGRGRLRWPLSAWLSNLVIAIGIAGLLAQVLASEAEFARPLRLASHLSITLVLLGVGMLLARPDDKNVRLLVEPTNAGMHARRLFVGVAIVPLVLSALLAWALQQDLLAVSDGLLLLIIGLIICGFAIAQFSISAAAGLNDDREEAEQARLLLTRRLQEQADDLQKTVALRTQELLETNARLQTVADSNALLAMVAQHTIDGVIITDAVGRVEWVNEAFTRISGFTLDDARGQKPGQFLQGPGTDPETVAKMRDAERNGTSFHLEVLNYTKDRTPFWQLVDMQPVRDRDGRLLNFIANQTDITSQRADTLRLEHLNDRLELATRAAELGIWEWDATTQKTIWDDRTLEIYGLRRDEHLGTDEDWVRRVHPQDRVQALSKRVETLAAGRDRFENEFRIVRANDGAERVVEVRAVVQRDPQGHLVRITGTERDVTARREATRQAKALNERLRLALRSSKYGVWEIDLVKGQRHWDERMFEIYGLTAGQFDGSEEAWRNTFHPDDLVSAVGKMDRLLASDESDCELQFRIIRPDGTVRHVESQGHVLRDDAGQPLRLGGLTRDLTEQKMMEQALDLAEQRWQLAIEGTNDAVWDWDLETDSVFNDERWGRMLGYDRTELSNTNSAWKSLAHPDDLAANEAALAAHFAQQTPFYQHELRMRAKDGGWRWILDRGRVVRRAPDGRPLRMAGTHTDITARKQLEERLRKTEELANEVSRLAQIGGWEIDLVASTVTWTDGTRRIHEVDAAFQPTIENIWDFFPPESLATVQAAIRDVTPAAPSFDLEVPLLSARARRIWVRILGHGEFSNGRELSIHGAVQDVTSRHQSEDSRRELEAQLFQAQKMETLGTLAGGIAHDFNNLLTGIIGYHELAADSIPEDNPARACLHEARNASLRARELVEQILTFGRQSGGGENGPIDLSLVADEARRFLRATLPANISIEVNCAPHCGNVLADATQIHQVILNLGSNAGHAMRQNGGVLRISLEPSEVSPDLALTLGGPAAKSYVRVSVSDTGHGMDEATRRRIFDPFFTTKNTREGTGLGLAVVHGIVRSHRGAIDVESTPGRGSVFHIYLPTAEENPVMEMVSEPAPRGTGEYICVVDDEEVVGTCTKLVLESKGYRSLIFPSAEACLTQTQADVSLCAVLVTDQTMPGMQGTELAAAMRKLNPNLPIVIMSGYFSKISPQALDELGQVELLAKPFTSDELAHAVHRALRSSARAVESERR